MAESAVCRQAPEVGAGWMNVHVRICAGVRSTAHSYRNWGGGGGRGSATTPPTRRISSIRRQRSPPQLRIDRNVGAEMEPRSLPHPVAPAHRFPPPAGGVGATLAATGSGPSKEPAPNRMLIQMAARGLQKMALLWRPRQNDPCFSRVSRPAAIGPRRLPDRSPSPPSIRTLPPLPPPTRLDPTAPPQDSDLRCPAILPGGTDRQPTEPVSPVQLSAPRGTLPRERHSRATLSILRLLVRFGDKLLKVDHVVILCEG